jgi:hypothetical protein
MRNINRSKRSATHYLAKKSDPIATSQAFSHRILLAQIETAAGVALVLANKVKQP